MRVKRGLVAHRKHVKLLKKTKGFRMTKRRLVKVAKEASLHAGMYAYAGRRMKKSNFRKAWILRIGQAVSAKGLSYSRFTHLLKEKNIIIDRKVLAYLVNRDMAAFEKIISLVK